MALEILLSTIIRKYSATNYRIDTILLIAQVESL